MCERHYRFGQMRNRAKADGKTVPTYEWLESNVPNDMKCPTCRRVMNWRQFEGASTVITLQHDRNGDFNFLCLACNSRHGAMQGDSFYELPEDHKMCPRCKEVKHLDNFCTDTNGRWKNKKSICRDCSTKYHAEWVSKTREEYNEKRRKYYHARKESGNPIPR